MKISEGSVVIPKIELTKDLLGTQTDISKSSIGIVRCANDSFVDVYFKKAEIAVRFPNTIFDKVFETPDVMTKRKIFKPCFILCGTCVTYYILRTIVCMSDIVNAVSSEFDNILFNIIIPAGFNVLFAVVIYNCIQSLALLHNASIVNPLYKTVSLYSALENKEVYFIKTK